MQRAIVVRWLYVKKNMRIVPLLQNAPYALDAMHTLETASFVT